ncbi:MAG: ABC transporter ATP-binding protein/permease [Rhodospirillaceae bacterium]|nr:ABC transporter ATP-binding protein/permease [Rhodospirillaceae bacterium]
MFATLRKFFGDLWMLTRPYWVSEDRIRARALLATIVGINLGLVYITVLINEWNNAFYNSLQDKDYEAFQSQIVRFSWLAALYIAGAVYQLYLNQMLQIRWRRWLTARYVDSWLDERAYYRMQLMDKGTDNPDQRIQEDLKLFVAQTLSLTLGLMTSVVTLGSFVTILWGLSGDLEIPFGDSTVVVPGYMLWAAIVYAIVGSSLTHRIGRPLVKLNFEQQRYEADFRFSLVRLRENAEGVALYRGEADERRSLMDRFGWVVNNWRAIMDRQKKLTWLTAGYGQIAIIFPFVVAVPRFFAGAIELGGLMQTASAFGQVQSALSWFVDAYPTLADWKATVDRLTGFEAATMGARTLPQTDRGPVLTPGPDPALTVEGMALDLPDGRALLADISLRIENGESVLIDGPSGSGKSTLFRAFAGIWPFGHGRIAMPKDARVLFLPQRPYLPLGTLRAVVSYPASPGAFSDQEVIAALRDSTLVALVDRLDENQHWALQLSPGEQQRLAIARALLHKPNWLFLDEATSSVDEPTETRLYQLVRERLPATTLVSIGHRPSLAAFHNRRLAIRRRDNGPAEVVPWIAPAAAAG